MSTRLRTLVEHGELYHFYLTGKMNLELKKITGPMKCFVWSVARYATELWTLTHSEKKGSEASEMWIYRRMENIKLAG